MPIPKKILATRAALFFGLWLMVAGWSPKDAPVGLIVAVGAAWMSLRFLPPGRFAPRFIPLVTLTGRFLRGSVVAGLDVARRALSPQLNLAPGFVAAPLDLPAGVARNAFCLHQSLQPGTLPTGAEEDALQVHCLDVAQPVAANLAADEALFKKAIGHE